MILGDGLTPVGKLSAAFLTPKTDLDLQFAYYESYLVVEFLVERFGLDSLKSILKDLGEGVPINDALTKHTVPIPALEKDFAEFARTKARNLGPSLDWTKPGATANLDTLTPVPPVTLKGSNVISRNADPKAARAAANDPNLKQSTNYYTLMRGAQRLIRERKWQEAEVPLERVIKSYPDQTGPDNAYTLLAEVHRRLGETNDEMRVLTQLAGIEADALEAYGRVMELGAMRNDWGTVATNAERYLAVIPSCHYPIVSEHRLPKPRITLPQRLIATRRCSFNSIRLTQPKRISAWLAYSTKAVTPVQGATFCRRWRKLPDSGMHNDS